MDLYTRMDLVLEGASEVVTEGELRNLLETCDRPTGYIGFEPSGLAHIGWLIVARKLRQLRQAGFGMKVFLADWHAYINDKFGGDIEAIRTCGRYMEHVFRALDVGEVEMVWASDLCRDLSYWEKVLRIAKHTTLLRTRRALTIMGRKEEDAESDTSKLFYPAMQAADIYALDVDLALGGMDQRKAHMLARDAAEKLHWHKFVALHTPLLPGLRAGRRMDPVEAKMSKSKPDDSILIHDAPEDVARKIKKAYCPEGELEGNPVLDIWRHVLIPELGGAVVRRPERWGGDLEVRGWAELADLYASGQLHPADLKSATAEAVSKVLEPVRRYFADRPEALPLIGPSPAG